MFSSLLYMHAYDWQEFLTLFTSYQLNGSNYSKLIQLEQLPKDFCML